MRLRLGKRRRMCWWMRLESKGREDIRRIDLVWYLFNHRKKLFLQVRLIQILLLFMYLFDVIIDVCLLLWCLEAGEENGGDLDRIGMLITELIMWRDVTKSTLWFGFGSLCFLSTCFTKGINFRSAAFFFLFYICGHFFVMYSGNSEMLLCLLFQHILCYLAIRNSDFGCFVFIKFCLSKV